MRVAVLTTGTNNTQALYMPLEQLGHEVAALVYDVMPNHGRLHEAVAAVDPAWVLYLGALPGHHGGSVPRVEDLAAVGRRWPLVHLCCDGAEPVWWPFLQQYYDAGCFALQVNIDGVRVGPIGERGLTLLPPIDDVFEPRAWRDRPIRLGFAGNTHRGAREAMIWDLVHRGLLVYRPRDEDDGFAGFRQFMTLCRGALNHPMTGGTTSAHVKARLLEAALAGCLVYELAGSPAEAWFEPGVDYVAYRDVDDLAAKLALLRGEDAEGMASRFRQKVKAQHSPAVFWEAVLGRLGLGPSVAARQPPFRHWSMAAADPAPTLVATVGAVNLVRWRDAIYTVPQSLGPIDLAAESSHPRIKRHASLSTARAAVANGAAL